MNLDLTSVLEWFQSLRIPDSTRDWAIIVSLSSVVALGGIVLGGYLFWGTQTGSIVAASQDVPRAPIPVSREGIKRVLEAYQTRAINYTGRNFVAVDLFDPRPPTPKK
jgi:hypothetical protein